MAPKATPLGDVDGQPVDLVSIKPTGVASFTRRLKGDEYVTLLVEARAGDLPTFKRTDAGKLTRIERINIITAVELEADHPLAHVATELLDTAAGRPPRLPLGEAPE